MQGYLSVDNDLAQGIITSVVTHFLPGEYCGSATTAICIIEDAFTTHSAIGMLVPGALSLMSFMQKTYEMT